MVDRILHQGPGFTIALMEEAETLVPYGPAVRRTGDVNHGFIDLRDNPGLVDEIPEAKKVEGLAALLRAISTSPSLMSSTCEAAPFPPTEDRVQWQSGSFVNVMFREAAENRDWKRFEDLSIYLLHGVQPTSDHQIGFEFCIEPLRSFFGEQGCFSLLIRAIGLGNDEGDAWRALNYALNSLAGSLVRDRLQSTTP